MSLTTNLYSPDGGDNVDLRTIQWATAPAPNPGGAYPFGGVSSAPDGRSRVYDFPPGYNDLTPEQRAHFSWVMGRAVRPTELTAGEIGEINPSLRRLARSINGAVFSGHHIASEEFAGRLARIAGLELEGRDEGRPAADPEEDDEDEAPGAPEPEDEPEPEVVEALAPETAAAAGRALAARGVRLRRRAADENRPPEPVAAVAAAAAPEPEPDIFDLVGGAASRLWSLLTLRDALNFAPMPWLELRGSAEWATAERLPVALRKLYAADPARYDGCCAYLALAASGLPVKLLNGAKKYSERPEAEWRDATGARVLRFLYEHSTMQWRVFDVTGRLVAEDPAAGSRPRPGCVVLVGGLGHLAAIRNARTKTPLRLKAATGGKPFSELDKALFGRLRGPNTLEAAEFYAKCGIRAPSRGAKGVTVELPDGEGEGARVREVQTLALGVDLNAAYPTVLQDPRCIFPVPSLGDKVVEYASPRLLEVVPEAFMLVKLADETERRILGAAATPEAEFGYAWVWGGALEWLRGPRAKVACRGLFRVRAFVAGKRLADHPEALELVEGFQRAQELGSLAKAAKALLCQYSGWIEASASEAQLSEPIPRGRLSDDELTYLAAAWEAPDPVDGTTAEFEVEGSGTHVRITRSRCFRSTGRLAKLAVYSYVAARLAGICRLAGAPPDEVRTDAVYWERVPPRYAELRAATEARGCLWKYVADPDDPGVTLPSVFSHERAWTPAASPIVPPLVPRASAAEVLAAPALRAFLSGPAGVGKTHWVETVLAPEAARRGLEVVRLTPAKALAAAHAGYRTVASFLSAGQSRVHLSRRAQRQVIVLDEAGLCAGHEFVDLARLSPAGLVLIGDGAQLGEVNVERTARFLGLPEVAFDLHARDRYGGDPTMHAVVRACRDAVESWYRAWKPMGRCPERFIETLRELVEIVEDPAACPNAGPEAIVVGWRHRYVDPLGGSTVHAIQGRTVEAGTAIHVVDWEWADPRLVYTAVTRARSAGQIVLYTGTEAPGAGAADEAAE